MRFALPILAFLLMVAGPARAEMELSVYGGVQTAPHSDVSGTDPGGVGDFDFFAKWNGKSFSMPPYYGLRAMMWRNERFGWGIEFTHAKVYADQATRSANGFDRLEFTDGLNILTLNAMHRWPGQWGRVTPYVGGGVGLAIPHVDVETAGGKTYGYQVTGPAVRWMAGASYSLNERWSLFGEYQGTASWNNADLASGGSLKTRILTNAINVGASYRF